MRRLAVLVGALSLTVPAIVHAREPLVLEPSSSWNIDYSPETCKLGRKFGEGEESITAIFTKNAPGTQMQGLLVGEGLRIKSRSDFDVSWWPQLTDKSISRVLFGRTGKSWSTLFDFGFVDVKPDEDGPFQVDRAALRREELAAIAKVRELHITDGVPQPIFLRTGNMEAPMKAMETCLDALVESWGLDPEVQRSLSRMPTARNNPGSWITYRDYPSDALERGSEALISFRLILDEKGEITRCEPLGEFVEKDFKSNLCNLVKARAKMTPALGPDGSPVASFYVGRVIFTIG